ncbi:MAG TPA: hypothetical protein VF750_01970 [Sphingomicrobium sp.]
MRTSIALALTAALLLEGCSSRPREFTPSLAAAPADQIKFEQTISECRDLLVAGKLDSSGRLASGGAGAATGVAVGAAGTAAASGAGLYGGMAILGATMVAMPFAILGGAWGMSKIKRHKKEKAIRLAMTGCLHEHGYDVAEWQRAPKKKKPAVVAAAR